MNNSHRSSIRQATRRNTGSSFGPRANSVRAILRLSDKLNEVEEDYDVMREAVNGLLTVLDARAGLLTIRLPVAITYSKHLSHSESLASFEKTFRERAEQMLALFSFEPHKRFFDADGLMLIPLVWKKQTIGVLAFDREGKCIGPIDEAVVLSLSNQLAAIFGARELPFHNALHDGGHALHDDIEEAMAIQQSLLPAMPSLSCGLSIATHTQAAEYVGGDYFDLILVDPNKIGIIIADVEGKGISAALYTNLLRTIVHFLTRESSSTACVVGKINAILHKEMSSGLKLFTLFYAVFDAERKILTYTGSGHVRPIVVRAATGAIERLLSDGLPMGIEPCQHFSESSVQLFPDDIVVYFTDGVVEMANGEGSPFGDEQLAEIVRTHRVESAERIQNIILSALEDFSHDPLVDDLTIIVTKVMDR